jgi:hypothetical protein
MWISRSSLLYGIAFSLPFFCASMLVAMESKLFLSLIRPLGQTTYQEQVLVLTLIALVGVGGVVALIPIFKNRSFYIVNAIVGLTFITFSIFAGYGLGIDFYHCDILKIPNCD